MAKVKIRAEKIEAEHLTLGDLYSESPPPAEVDIDGDMGVMCFIRTNAALDREMIGKTVYKITMRGAKADKNAVGARFKMDPHLPPGIRDEQ